MAGIYSKVVSTTRQIDSIHTFINGVRTDIKTGWVFVNGVRKQVFPSTETYTQVYSKTTGGNYSTTLGYGKYKIVISGGGGSGSSVALRKTGSVQSRTQYGGSAGELKTIMIDVPYGQTWSFSGTVGTGGKGSSTYAGTSAHSQSAGAAGTGYANGTQGSTRYFMVSNYPGSDFQDAGYGAMAGGSGGGSTSLFVNGVSNSVARGGNGGSASLVNRYSIGSGTESVSGGTGGSGGISNGTGAAGGAASYGAGSSSGNTSGAGTNGYIRIYKSSIFPN